MFPSQGKFGSVPVPAFKQLQRSIPCAVCHLPSSGRHYGAFCCGGCRNFFKRSLTIYQTYFCNHLVTTNSKCKMCRFKACIQAGMSMEAIRFGRPSEIEKAEIAEMVKGTSSKATTDSQLGRNSEEYFESLMTQLKTKMINLVVNFHSIANSNDTVGFLLALDKESAFPIVAKLNNDMENISNFVRSIPGVSSKVAISDRETIIAHAVYPILTCRSFSKLVNNYDDPLSFLLGITNQQSAAVIFQQFFNEQQDFLANFYKLIADLKQNFHNLQMDELELAIVYGLIAFDLSVCSKSSSLENGPAIEHLSQIYSSLNKDFFRHKHGRSQQIWLFVNKLAQVRHPLAKIVQGLISVLAGDPHVPNVISDVARINATTM